ncbi:yteA family sporulation protein [Bacillus sp. SM2101]|uniref:yteA family sporulation protein n=1 Tax=Bacillus sp. SM2101 TaxID=2805366 RepID=UPI001BDF2944|nr:yteA family sporulation protein [Bacillus sp. SM2101]
MLTKDQSSAFRSSLITTRNQLKSQLKANNHFNLKLSDAHDSVGELSSYDNHPGDLGTELYEREKDISLLEHVEKEITDIENALDAIDNGTYGTCIVCGKDIPIERLQALPTALHCKEHSPDQAVSHNRPIEEGVLLPPYGKFNNDDKDAVSFDAEDSWQEVARFGTSESPSDLVNPPDHYNDMYIESDENLGYVEDYENFAGTDIEGKNVKVYPNIQHEKYEQLLDEEGMMTPFGDLLPYEKNPYTEESLEDSE